MLSSKVKLGSSKIIDGAFGRIIGDVVVRINSIGASSPFDSTTVASSSVYSPSFAYWHSQLPDAYCNVSLTNLYIHK
ncbi:hypothetical protein GOP47_0009548 [Adiantum capillus-veneris]|uniref:Uncharacterized protein n=1 Tax=Adiantum capillus-veneris TaxID=13818 RepID=A0A9D4ZIT8_ADICA|nr:hypothetical protein GOP47_0009548 [Adiantum capillus-veneris]